MLELGELMVDTAFADGWANLRAVGDLDLRSAELLIDTVEALVADAPLGIAIDGAEIGYVDSAGVRALALGLVLAHEAGVAYRVASASEGLDRVLAVTGLAEAMGR